MKARIIAALLGIILMVTCTGCAEFESSVNDLTGSITGNTYRCEFYTNTGDNFMNASGTNIGMNSNIVKEYTYTSDGWETTKTVSSVMTITIDGSQIESCGSTILFVENGLNPDVDFNQEEISEIQSNADSFLDNVFIANVVNRYTNSFGKPIVVVIQSQLGDPICAYSGNDVYWEVSQDLPKTTKLMIDGKALYIHRANFQIIDKNLLV